MYNECNRITVTHHFFFFFFFTENPKLSNYNRKQDFSCNYHHLGSIWYMYLKTENCCLKIFVEIHVGIKVR